MLFVFRLLRSFDKVFSPLLNGHCMISSHGRVRLFAPSFFALDFIKLRSLADKLEMEAFRYSRFPLSRFLQIKEGRLQAIGTEAEVSQLIIHGAICLADLGRTVMKIVSLRSPPENTPCDALQPVILHGKAFAIPFEDGTIVARTPLNGRSVLHALGMVVTVAFSAGIFLQDDFVSMFYARQKKLESELHRCMKSLQGLLDAESYHELVATYE